jgi:hypothetical protein
MNPDNFLTGGLKDDFDGTVLKARFVPWDYDGNIDHHILAVALTIQPDDEDTPFVQHYSAGELESFVPSMDGKTSVDLDNGEGEQLEGIYAMKVGRRDQLNNNTNWAHFIGAALDAKFPREKLGSTCTFIEGVHGHWNRIPQKKRSGIVVQPAAEGKRRSSDILVLTSITEGGKATAKPATKVGPQPAAATQNGLDEQLAGVVLEAIMAADGKLAKSKLPGIAIKAFQGPDKAKAVKRVSEAEFLESSDTWMYDADKGTLSLIE